MIEIVAQIILAVVQGLSEWFPISSSGHLVIVSHLLDYTNTLAFDIALHFGTLMAVFVYFGKDITDIARDLLSFKFNTEPGRMGLYVILASIPAGILGFLFRDFFERTLNDLSLLSLGLSITGVLLIITSLDRVKPAKKELSARIAFLVGCAQVASLFRGISRSGSTMSSGILLGLDPKKAARFSFLMSIPIIFGANILSLSNAAFPTSYLLPTLISFLVGIASIHFLLKIVLVSKKNLRWFGVYILLLALTLGLSRLL